MNELGSDVKDDAQLRQWAAEPKEGRPARRPSPANCLYLERATDGAVTRQAMRPDDYRGIWPELDPPAKKPRKQQPATA